ncbi:MAG: DUF2244 domain-containing protein [Burkholderiales bacterium]|jgi:uncharacterized membrane protein
MWSAESLEGVQFEIISRRNNSSSRNARLLVFGSLGLFTLLIAVGFVLMGAWPVLPFAGLECVALLLAYVWLYRHDDDYELIAIDGDDIVVEAQDGGKLERRQLSRYWARVIVEEKRVGQTRVFLRAHGREVEFGRLLPDNARKDLARRLRTRLSGLG